MHKVTDVFVHVPHEAPRITQSQKILLCVTSASPQLPDHKSGFWLDELLQPYEIFTNAGYDVDIISENGMQQVDELSISKMAMMGTEKKWNDKQYPLHQKLVQIRPASSITSVNDYIAIFFAGGHGCVVDYPHAVHLQKLAAQIYERGGIVGAVCHGIAIFENLRLSNGRLLLEGKEATGFSTKAEESFKYLDWMRNGNYHTMEQVVKMCGGRWSEHDSDPMKEYIRSDDRVVTGMNPESDKAVAERMLTLISERTKNYGSTIGSSNINAVNTGVSSSTLPASGIQGNLGSSTLNSGLNTGARPSATTLGNANLGTVGAGSSSQFPGLSSTQITTITTTTEKTQLGGGLQDKTNKYGTSEAEERAKDRTYQGETRRI
jgi:putative intracellular protease/amidase